MKNRQWLIYWILLLMFSKWFKIFFPKEIQKTVGETSVVKQFLDGFSLTVNTCLSYHILFFSTTLLLTVLIAGASLDYLAVYSFTICTNIFCYRVVLLITSQVLSTKYSEGLLLLCLSYSTPPSFLTILFV
jgi:small-conductance mechanosensitive channel